MRGALVWKRLLARGGALRATTWLFLLQRPAGSLAVTMAKDKLRKPKGAREASSPSPSLLGAGLVAILAIGVATAWVVRPAAPRIGTPSGGIASSFTEADRMAASSEGDEPEGRAAEACGVVRVLWEKASESEQLGCTGFLARHWETTPRLAQPGAAWSGAIMRLEDVRSMVSTFAFRIHKNHGTALLQVPASGFQADKRWQRGDDIPPEIVEIAMREQRTLVLHNLEVYWPAITTFARELVRFFHTYTQVNMYLSPAGLDVATVWPARFVPTQP